MPAPKGHTFSIGNSGKPKTFKSPDELQLYVDEYFKKEDDNPIKIWHSQLDKKTNKPVEMLIQRPYAIEGLALHLGLTRQTLLNYEKREGYEKFFDIIVCAKEKIRLSLIQNALVGGLKERFAEFVLTNNSTYVNASKIDHGSSDGTMSPKSTIIVVDKEAQSELEKMENEND